MSTKLSGEDVAILGCGTLIVLAGVALIGGFAFILWAIGWRVLSGA